MLIEAVEKPLRYRWPAGEVILEPGRPIQMPSDRANRLLAKAGNKVRVFRPDWLTAWQELAALTDGITKDDARFRSVLAALDACDAAYLANDWVGFQRAAEVVRVAARG